MLKLVLFSVILLVFCAEAKDASLKDEWKKLQTMMAPAGLHPSMFLTTRKKMNDTLCNRDLNRFVEDFLNSKSWALKMVDSMAKIPAGLMSYNRILFGSMDDCLAITPAHGIKPQFCTFSIQNKTVIKTFNVYFNWRRGPYMFVGLCLPASCPGRYIAQALSGLMSPRLNLKLANSANVTVDSGDCQTKDSVKPWTQANSFTIGIFGALVVLAAFATLADLLLNTSKTGFISSYIDSFSIIRSGRKIFVAGDVDAKTAALNGLRGLMAIYILWGHSLLFTSMGNSLSVFSRLVVHMLSTLTLNFSFFAVDFFLFVSGLLTTVTFYMKLHTNKSYDPLVAFLSRYLRMIVPVAIIILYKMGLSEHMDKGPIYNVMNNYYRKPCPNTALAIVLGYVNWIIDKPHKMCYQQFWYNSLDTQLFLVSQLILLTTWWKMKAVPYISLGLGLVLTINTFMIAYTHGLAPFISVAVNDNNNTYDYLKTYTRGVPWFLGMFVGCIISDFQSRPKQQVSKLVQALMWLVTIGLIALLLTWGGTFSLKDYSQPSSALFLSLSRVLVSIVFSWLVFAIFFNMSGYVGKTLSWYPFDFLGRISFEIFLVHVAAIEFVQASSREHVYMTKDSKWHIALLPLGYTIPSALLLNIFVTSPWNKLMSRLAKKLALWPLKSPLPNKKGTKRLEESDDTKQAGESDNKNVVQDEKVTEKNGKVEKKKNK